MPLLGCIADDFTGATDLAATLVRDGMRTVQLIGVPQPDDPVPDADAVVVALKSRTVAGAAGGRREPGRTVLAAATRAASSSSSNTAPRSTAPTRATSARSPTR